MKDQCCRSPRLSHANEIRAPTGYHVKGWENKGTIDRPEKVVGLRSVVAIYSFSSMAGTAYRKPISAHNDLNPPELS